MDISNETYAQTSLRHLAQRVSGQERVIETGRWLTIDFKEVLTV
jgi:hypothetical protein